MRSRTSTPKVRLGFTISVLSVSLGAHFIRIDEVADGFVFVIVVDELDRAGFGYSEASPSCVSLDEAYAPDYFAC